MYLYHFSLQELPFTLTPNTSFYVDLQSHREAVQVLTTALQMGEGFIKVVGEVGTGKTLLCRKLLAELPDSFVTAYVPDPNLSPAALRLNIATELGLPQRRNVGQHELIQSIQAHLVKLCAEGKSAVLIVDEAQALSFETLEAVRLLTNLETERRKLLQVVLLGQPELNERLADNSLRQLRQRIAFSYELRPITVDEVGEYIRTRLSVASINDNSTLFADGLLPLISEASRGTPRLVNLICHKALMLAYGEGKFAIEHNHIVTAINDTEDATPYEEVEITYLRGFWIILVCLFLSGIAIMSGLAQEILAMFVRVVS